MSRCRPFSVRLTAIVLLSIGWPALAAEESHADTLSTADAANFGREIEFGIAAHDVNGEGGREHGFDVAVELRGERLEGVFWRSLLTPRPHIGVNIQGEFKTSSLFAGLTWAAPLGDGYFVSAEFGGAVHNGKLHRTTSDRVALGSRVLFREALEVGVRVTERWRVAIRADHMSNADLASPNDGVTTVGLMLSRSF